MNLNYETILDFYTFKRKKFLCQIKVNQKSQKSKNTCRCLSQEQWAIFDKTLEKLLTNNKLGENGYRFNLDPLIEVKIQKSKLSFKYFYELLDTNGELNKSDPVDVTEKHLVLECLIDIQLEVPFNSSVETQEYEPEVSISPSAMICGPLPYEPYTPSKKKLDYKVNLAKNNDNNYLEGDENTYSPKPLLDEGINTPHFATLIPQYTPAPITDRKKLYKENNKLNLLKETSDEKNSLGKQSSKQYKRVECEYIPVSRDITIHNAPIYIPTPIQEMPQELCNRENVRTFRKRSNTIDVFSKLNRDEKEKLTMQQIYDENRKHLSQNILKKRSMTIDEIPADFASITAYIPSPLDEKSDLKQDQYSSKFLRFKKNNKILPNDQSCIEAKKVTSTTAISNCDIIPGIENSAATINEKQAAITQFNIIQKSRQNNDDRNPRNKVIDLSLNNTDRVFNDATVEKNLFSTMEKSLVSEGQSGVKNFKRNPENDIKSKICNGIDKCMKDKNLLEHLTFKGAQPQVSLKPPNQIENCGAQAVKKCRRSERSPNKRKRLIEEQLNTLNKTVSKNHKSSLKNKELFGTDDEDDDEPPSKNINNNKMFSTLKESFASKDSNMSISSSSKKKKHKKGRNSEAERETK